MTMQSQLNNQALQYSPLAYPGGYEISSLMALKAICAFLVIQLHILSDYKEYAIPICRIAVPIFFMISGYFMFNSSGQITSDKLKRSLLKILKITFWINILYILYWVIAVIENLQYLGVFTNPNSLIQLILYGDTFCFGLWYLTAYIQALLIIWLFSKLRALSVLYWLIPIGLFVNLFWGTYSHLHTDTMFNGFYNRNVFTIGLPCVAIGMLIRKYQHRLKLSSAVLIITTLMLLGATYFECFYCIRPYIMHYGDIVITTIPLSIAVFLTFLHIEKLGRCKVLNDIGKYHSLNIYLIHILLIWTIVNYIPFPFSFPTSVLIFVLSLMLSYIYIFMKAKLRLSFLP